LDNSKEPTMQLTTIDCGSPIFEANLKILMDEALGDPNPNTQNLCHLLTRRYLLKNLVMDETGPVAFGAIEDFSQNGVRCARLLTRTYYMKRARNTQSWRKISSGPIVRHLLPIQVFWAINNGFDMMFVSMESLEKRKVLESWVFAVNEWSHYQWAMEDDLFFTCKCNVNNDVRCWQNVASLKLSNASLPLHRTTIDFFKKSAR